MKKYLAVLAALVMGLSSCSCGILYALYRTNRAKEEREKPPAVTEAGPGCSQLDLSAQEDFRVPLVELRGDHIESYSSVMSNEIGHVLHKGVVGRFGCPISVDQGTDLTNAKLIFHYDSQHMDNIPTGNLIVLHFDEEAQFYNTIPSTLNEDACTVTAPITEPGVYLLADSYAWGSAWGESDAGEAHDTIWRCDEFSCIMTIPKEIHVTEVGDYLKQDEDGMCKTLLECDYNENIQIGIEYLERPFYDSAKDFTNDMAKQIDQNGFLQKTGTIVEPSGRTCYYWYADFSDGGDTIGSLSMNCIVPLSDTQYINIWYGFTSEKYFDVAMQSLQSFHFTAEPDVPEPESTFIFNSDSASITAKDITIEPPEGVTVTAIDSNWENSGDNKHVLKLLKCSGTGVNVRSVSVDLEENRLSAGKTAAKDANALTMQGAKLLDSKQIQQDENLSGYLYKLENGSNIELYGYYDIPDSHQYCKASVILTSAADEKEQAAYWKMLESVKIVLPDAAFSAENLKLQLPEGFAATPAGYQKWSREYDNYGNQFYRKFLLDADYTKSRKDSDGRTEYSGAFFYLIDSGESAKDAMQKQIEQHLGNELYNNMHITDQAEVTLSGGQKGYLVALREDPRNEPGDYRECYMYGYYEVSDAAGSPTGEYVEIDFWLREPLADAVYKDYWNCLKTADIVW